MESDQAQEKGTAAGPGSTLRRMAQSGREVRQARAMSLPKALRLTLAKVADELFDMAMAVIGVRAETRDSDDLAEVLTPGTLLVVLDGPRRRRAAAVIDRATVGALIQQQTMGKVMPANPDDERPMTATDAAICAPFLDALLSRAALLPEDPDERQLLDGMKFGARVENARLLLMALEEPEYEIFHLTVDIAGGVRQGQITLCLPCAQDLSSPPDPGKGDSQTKGDTPPKPASLDRNVLALNADLNVALSKLKMSVGALQGLQVGQVLELGGAAFNKAVIQTRDGRALSRGTLGQIDGFRAVQLEHAAHALRQPRRRASDRAELELPQVSGDGTGTQSKQEVETPGNARLPGNLPTNAQMPEMNDLPDLDELPDLPDMSDLPGFEEEEEMLQRGTG